LRCRGERRKEEKERRKKKKKRDVKFSIVFEREKTLAHFFSLFPSSRSD